MEKKKYLSKTIALFLSLSLVLSYTLFLTKITRASSLTWSTPEKVTQNAGFFDMVRDSSGVIHVVYHNKTESRGVSYLENDAKSEILSSLGQRIAQRFVTPSNMGSINKITIQDSAESDLNGYISIHADDSGQPSSMPINGTYYGIVLNHGSPTEYTLNEEISVYPSTTYWLVFGVDSGSGTFDGGATGPQDQCMYFDGESWNLSSNIENMYFVIEGYEGGIYYIEGTEKNWSEPINISGDDFVTKIFSITVDNNNQPHVVYNIRKNGLDFIVYIKKTGSSWSVPEIIASNAQYYLYSRPVIVTDSLNYSHVVYFGRDPDVYNYGLYYTNNTNGDWSSPIEISSGTANYTFDISPAPALNIDSSDKLHVAYYHQNPDYSIDVYYINNVLGPWSTPEQVSETSANNYQFPSASALVIDNEGIVHIAYNNAKIWPYFDVYYANNSGPGRSWVREKITSNSSTLSLFPSMVLDKNDNLYIVYKEISVEGSEISENMNIVFTFKEKGSSAWSTLEIITTTPIIFDEVFSSPPILMYGSLHLGYLGKTIVYYTYSQLSESQQPSNGEQPGVSNGKKKFQEKPKVKELPETGSNTSFNFFTSLITPCLVEKTKVILKKKNI